MKILATVKPVHHIDNKHNYAYLIEIDLESNEIIRKLKIPSASYHSEDGFMTNFAQGLTSYGKKIYLAYWNFIAVVDYETFVVEDSFSHPFMSDLHGISCDQKRIFITSTNLDSILCFDRIGYDLLWRWGPDVEILTEGRKLWTIKKSRINKKDFLNVFIQKIGCKKIKYKFVERDYRNVHKSKSPYHNHHLNDVALKNNHSIYFTTKGWNNFENGRIFELNLNSMEAKNILDSHSFHGFRGLHDCLIVGDSIYVTESSRNHVSWIDKNKEIHSIKVEEKPYFVRGICYTGSDFLVGFSTLRNTNHPAKIVRFDTKFKKIKSTVLLNHLYPEYKKSAVHSIILSPVD